MQLEHSFVIPVDVEQAWKVLLDIQRIAPCMPGAAIDSVDGDDFTGSVKVKLGPINLTYKGKASFIEKDEAAHRAVIDARGKDARGAGTASARVTATLVSDSENTTKVDVLTDLDITGKPAQFGRGVMVDVGNKLLGQFADCLAGKLAESDEDNAAHVAQAAEAAGAAAAAAADKEQAKTTGAAAPTEPGGETADPPSVPAAAPAQAVANGAGGREGRPAPARHAAPPRQEVEPIDLIESAGPAVAKRLAPVVGAVLLLVLLVVVLRRRSR